MYLFRSICRYIRILLQLYIYTYTKMSIWMYVYIYIPIDFVPTDISIRMQSHILYTAEVTAFHSGSVSHHCRSRPVLLALLPA